MDKTVFLFPVFPREFPWRETLTFEDYLTIPDSDRKSPEKNRRHMLN